MEKAKVASQIWLLYFNKTLFDKQLITLQEYQKLRILILRTDKTVTA